MGKKDLIKALESSVKTQESATTLYLNHLEAISTRFNIDKKFIEQAREVIEKLIQKNHEHKKEMEALLLEIDNSSNEEF